MFFESPALIFIQEFLIELSSPFLLTALLTFVIFASLSFLSPDLDAIILVKLLGEEGVKSKAFTGRVILAIKPVMFNDPAWTREEEDAQDDDLIN